MTHQRWHVGLGSGPEDGEAHDCIQKQTWQLFHPLKPASASSQAKAWLMLICCLAPMYSAFEVLARDALEQA